MKCYCNSNKDFNQCCQPILNGKATAETAEQLMRSRYTAYVLADIEYILNTHHPMTRPVSERHSIRAWTKSVKWTGLEVLNTQKGSAMDVEGYVEFKASFTENGKPDRIHENSYFRKENGQWFYLSGSHK